MKSQKKRGSRTGSIVALCIVLVCTVVLGVLGAGGWSIPPRGLYRVMPWLPSTSVDNWPAVLSLGLDLREACMWSIPPRRRKALKPISAA